jgi:alanyl-tRNA synthetase
LSAISQTVVKRRRSDDDCKRLSVVTQKFDEGLTRKGDAASVDNRLAKLKSGVVVLARTEDDKVSFIVRVSDDLTEKVKAGRIVQEIAPIVGGRGGGKPDMAEGGGTDAGKLMTLCRQATMWLSECWKIKLQG